MVGGGGGVVSGSQRTRMGAQRTRIGMGHSEQREMDTRADRPGKFLMVMMHFHLSQRAFRTGKGV